MLPAQPKRAPRTSPLRTSQCLCFQPAQPESLRDTFWIAPFIGPARSARDLLQQLNHKLSNVFPGARRPHRNKAARTRVFYWKRSASIFEDSSQLRQFCCKSLINSTQIIRPANTAFEEEVGARHVGNTGRRRQSWMPFNIPRGSPILVPFDLAPFQRSKRGSRAPNSFTGRSVHLGLFSILMPVMTATHLDGIHRPQHKMVAKNRGSSAVFVPFYLRTAV